MEVIEANLRYSERTFEHSLLLFHCMTASSGAPVSGGEFGLSYSLRPALVTLQVVESLDGIKSSMHVLKTLLGADSHLRRRAFLTWPNVCIWLKYLSAQDFGFFLDRGGSNK